MTVKHWNTGASAVRFRDQAGKRTSKERETSMKRTLEDYYRGTWHKWGKNELVCYDDGKPLRSYKYLEDTDFIKPRNKEDCIGDIGRCDNEYICFMCEAEQIREKYPKVKYTDECEWVIPTKSKKKYI